MITNIGNFDRQYPYKETEFFEFDNFLFASWSMLPYGKGKYESHWGGFLCSKRCHHDACVLSNQLPESF